MKKGFNLFKRLKAHSFIRFLLSVAGAVLLVYLFSKMGFWMQSI